MSATGDQPSRGLKDEGTTLIEALVVVTILTMASAIVFPRMEQGMLGFAQKESASAIAAQLRRSRAEAMRRDAPVSFAVQMGGRGYASSFGMTGYAPPGVALSVGPRAGQAITFFGDGSSAGGVVHVATRGRSIDVSVTPGGGAVEMAHS